MRCFTFVWQITLLLCSIVWPSPHSWANNEIPCPTVTLKNNSFENPASQDQSIDNTTFQGESGGNWKITRNSSPRFTFQLRAEGPNDNRRQFVETLVNDQWGGLYQEIVEGTLSSHCQYRLAASVRYNGHSPEAPAGRIRVKFEGKGTDQDGKPLKIKKTIDVARLSDVTSDWRTFHTIYVSPCDLTDPVSCSNAPAEVHITSMNMSFFVIGFGLDTTSRLHVDSLSFDALHQLEMYSMHPTLMVANNSNMVVPNWFKTTAAGKDRIATETRYIFDVPQGLTLRHVGSQPNGSTIGVSPGPYKKVEIPSTHSSYTRYEVQALQVHKEDRLVGPLYFTSSLPAEAEAAILYWTELHGDKGPVSTPPRTVIIKTKTFPELSMPKLLYSSLQWIQLKDQMSWPDYLETASRLGFNTISSHRNFDNPCPKNFEIPSTSCVPNFFDLGKTQEWLALADTLGYRRIQVDSGMAGLQFAQESWADPQQKSPSPCYDKHPYQEEIKKIAAHAKQFKPHLLMLDIELYETGANLAQKGKDRHCPDRMTQKKLAERGTKLGQKIREEIGEAGLSFVPPIGYYNVAPDIPNDTDKDDVYHIFDFEQMYKPDGSGNLQFGQPVFYGLNPRYIGEKFRVMQPHKFPLNPFITPGYQELESTDIEPVLMYDLVLELFGSGAKGISWFEFSQSSGADFYYYAKALQSILPVEEIIWNGQPVWVNFVQSENDAVRASALQHNNEFLLLLSSYGKGSKGSGPPQYKGNVTIAFNDRVLSGTPFDLERRTVGQPVKNKRGLTLYFAPKLGGVHTALYYFCDSTHRSCDRHLP